MADQTETIRRELVEKINTQPGSRDHLEEQHGKVWDTSELQEDFQVLGFLAPFVIVSRRADSVRGSLMFQSHPRFYFSFKPE